MTGCKPGIRKNLIAELYAVAEKKQFFVLLLIVQGNNQSKPDFCLLTMH